MPRDHFRAAGGHGISLGRSEKRGAWPGYAPEIQPGFGRLPGEDPGDARFKIEFPPGMRYDPTNPAHVSLALSIGVQGALSDPHVRMLIQSAIDNAARAAFRPVVNPPWIQKPFRGVDFGASVSMDVPGDDTWTTMVDTLNSAIQQQFTVPQGHMAVLTEFAQDAISPTDWDSLCWRLTRNDLPLFPWNNVCCQMGTLNSPRKVQIILYPGDTIRLQVKNSTIGPDIDNVGGWMYGWYWPMPSQSAIENAHGQAQVA
jgi:hypothetical protein